MGLLSGDALVPERFPLERPILVPGFVLFLPLPSSNSADLNTILVLKLQFSPSKPQDLEQRFSTLAPSRGVGFNSQK